MKQSDRDSHINWRNSMLCEITNIVANKCAAASKFMPGAFDISRVAIKTDVIRTRQIMQQCSRTAADIQHSLTTSSLYDVTCESSHPATRSDQVMKGLVDQRICE